MTIGKAEKGAVTSLRDRATGRELIAPQNAPRLLLLAFSDKTKPGSDRFYVSSAQAAAVRFDLQRGPDSMTAVVQFDGIADLAVRVRCTATVTNGDPMVRWRLTASLANSLVLEEAQFPILTLRAPLSDPQSDAVVLGRTKGGVFRRPSGWKENAYVYAHQPGQLAAQFGCYYDDAGGLFSAAEDAKGYPKAMKVRRVAEGLDVEWDHYCFATESFALDYDVAETVFASPDPARPADWRDAADIYKAWAEKQPWCARRYADRPDVPAWLKSGPAMVRFGRDWLAHPERIEDWLNLYWRRFFPHSIPIIVAYWGWEKVGTWVTPDYFPAYPSDEQFIALLKATRRLNCHAFAWPSGYHYTLTYDKRDDGTFAWDDRARFHKVALPHAVRNRDGSVWLREAFWLRGGEMGAMCPGDPWTIHWLNETAVQLAKRGVEMTQVDQVVGGSFPTCCSTSHGHPPGPGLWVTQVFRKQLQTMLRDCRQIEPDAVVCFEEPNERFIQQAAIQDYRDWEALQGQPPAEPASVFNYVYHEYLPTFQSNPRAGDRVEAGYCLVNGQIPHLVPSQLIGPGPALLNGGFEDWTGSVPDGWSQVTGYRGQAFRGRAFQDADERHGGRFSLRLENDADDDIAQVSQNVAVGRGIRIGGTYRLSVWMRTAGLEQPNAVLLATLTQAIEATGQWQIPMPEGDRPEWTRGEVTFTVPEGSDVLRIMLHLSGKGRVWLDDVVLDEVHPDGAASVLMRPETPQDHEFMHRWVELFSGDGRPYLLLGRMIHPPKLDARTIAVSGQTIPAILHNAYRAPDGSEAVIALNVTDDPQSAKLTWKGVTRETRFAPWQIRLIR